MAQERNRAQSSQRPGNVVKASFPIGDLLGDGRKSKPGLHAGSKCIAFKDGKDCGAVIAESNHSEVPICRPCQQRLRDVAIGRGWDINDLVAISQRLRRENGLKRESAA
ncbi:MAG: hypothetical protein RDU25_01145 [Patescibacteria group bacterium]|nr:hypothetical protein [Patescibacteria group bacterium]